MFPGLAVEGEGTLLWILFMKSLPIFCPIVVEEFKAGNSEVLGVFCNGRFGGIVVFQMGLTDPIARRDKDPLVVSEDCGQKFGEDGVVDFELITGADVIVIVVHRTVCVIPTLNSFSEILAAILGGIASLLSSKNDEHLVLPCHFDLCRGGLSIDENVSAIKAFAEERCWLIGKGFGQFGKQADRLVVGNTAKALSGATVIPEAHSGGVDEGSGPAFGEFFVETSSVDDMAEFVDEDAFNLHPAFVFHHVFLGEKDDIAVLDFGEESPLPPVVEIKVLAGFIRFEFGKIRGEFVVGDEEAEDFFVTDSLSNGSLEVLHHAIEKVGSFLVGGVGNLVGGCDEDVLDQGRLRVEVGIQIVFIGDFWAQGFHLMSSGGAEKEEGI